MSKELDVEVQTLIFVHRFVAVTMILVVEVVVDSFVVVVVEFE